MKTNETKNKNFYKKDLSLKARFLLAFFFITVSGTVIFPVTKAVAIEKSSTDRLKASKDEEDDNAVENDSDSDSDNDQKEADEQGDDKTAADDADNTDDADDTLNAENEESSDTVDKEETQEVAEETEKPQLEEKKLESVESKTISDIDQRTEKNIDQSREQRLDQRMDQSNNQSMDQNRDRRLDPKPREELVEVIPYQGNVEVLKFKNYENYKDRRTTNGFMMYLGSENLYFADYVSQHDQLLYEELWGNEDLTVPELNINYKFNFLLGSLTFGLGFGQGSLLDDRIGDERTIAIEKISASIQFLADNLMREPYFVPYVGASVFQFKVSESVKSVEKSYESTSDVGYSFSVGFLIQLNWIEKEVSKQAYLEHGLENTYLDFHWTKHENPNDDPKPNLESDINWGAGLRVEF